MKWKRKIRKFFTLNRHHEAGFTLVELIVVIAIMAILAGVGSVGYSGYIKSANKGNDKVLVGNIMRAIETGVNSTMYISDDSFKMGSISYPVGIVILSADGTEVINSTTEIIPPTEGKCEFVTVSVSTPSATTASVQCNQGHNKSKEVYTLSSVSVTYCNTHTDPANKPYELTADLNTGKAAALSGTGCSAWTKYGCNATWSATSTLTIPAGSIYCANTSKLYGASSSPSMCEAAYANQFGTFAEPEVGPAETGDPIYDSLVAAFGDLSSLKLTYDKWTTDEGLGYPSFYSSAPDFLDSVENLSGLLAFGSQISADKLGLSQKYSDSEEVLGAVTNNIVTTHKDADSWLAQWNNDSKMTWDSYGFGIGGRENYSAARVSYNTAFASYMEANGMGAYAGVIKDFNSQEILGVGLPGLVCTDAFTDTASPLPGKLTDAGATAEDIQAIQDLYKKYVDSGDCATNGAAFYDTMKTFADTSDVANAYTDLNGGSIYDYYGSYVNEISAMYSAAQSKAGEGIVIVVTMVEGKVQFQVSPGAANPRND